MSIQRVFELIRREEIVLFCGAGMSLYAGYPSGDELSELIFDSLTADEKEVINKNLPLRDLTNDITNLRLGSKQSLYSILRQTFGKAPLDTSLHRQIADIPHIKTIITTNYDSLFETAYGERCTIIRTSNDIPYIDRDKTTILKIHGDLSLPNSIIITSKDYTRFFDSNAEEPLWTLVKERITTKHVLFLGYSLDDPNVESLFRKVGEQLGPNMREAYFISPNLNKPKERFLASEGITYIDSTAQFFFNALVENIAENIQDDFNKKYIGPDTLRVFLKKHNLKPSLATEKDQFKISHLDSVDKSIGTSILLRLSSDTADFLRRLSEFIESRELGEFTVKGEKDRAKIYLNGIKVSDNNDFVISHSAVYEGLIDIQFNNGEEYNKLAVKIFRTKQNLLFVFNLPTGKLTLETALDLFKDSTYQLRFERLDDYQSVADELATYNFLKNLAVSGGITLFKTGGNEPTSFSLLGLKPLEEETERFVFYFENLKKIERFFKIRFDKIGVINTDSYHTLLSVIHAIERKPIEHVWKQSLKFKPTDPTKIPLFLSQLDEGHPIVSEEPTAHIVTLHGRELNLGHRVFSYMDPYIENLRELQENPMIDVIIKSKSEKAIMVYKTPDELLSEESTG